MRRKISYPAGGYWLVTRFLVASVLVVLQFVCTKEGVELGVKRYTEHFIEG